jgi:hypothetical protein
MGRVGLEIALRQAGVGRNLSIALAADLAGGRAGDVDLDEEVDIANGTSPESRPRLVGGTDLEERWGLPALAADADVCGGFGDLCGRRVA